jgi:hypothetical protein
MNYYIQGDAANADKIKAAFEAKGYKCTHNCDSMNFLYYTINNHVTTTGIQSHTRQLIMRLAELGDYSELELPVEPKFKVGDWIVQNDNGTVSQITKTINGKDEYGEYRAYEHTNGYFAACFENEYHPWTIADARDGDVITNGKLIVIFNKLEEPAYKQHIIAYVGLDLCGKLQITEDTWQLGVDKAMPATKEQRDLLFAKMKEAGYKWDADKKELKKIPKHYDISNFHAGMPVLVRIRDEHKWCYVLFSHRYIHQGILHFHAGGAGWLQCIPFNDDTKHLLGTTDMCDEQYINW